MTHIELYREREQIGPFAHDGSDWDNPTRPGKWRWRFVSNGYILADSGQGYSRRIDCLAGCARVLGGVLYPDEIRRHRNDHDFARGIAWEVVPIRDLTKEAKP